MNHDIAHCNREDCKVKESCYRYKAHLEAVEKKITFLTYFIPEQITLDKEGKCEMYMSLK